MSTGGVPWESPMWGGKLRVALGFPSHGWVQLALLATPFNQNLVVHCSDVFPPFDDLLAWLNRIADNDLPAEFAIDEEGQSKRFVASETLTSEDLEFCVFDDDDRHVLRCRLDRRQIVREFVRSLQSWLADDYDPAEFGYDSPAAYADGHGFDLRTLPLHQLAAKIGKA